MTTPVPSTGYQDLLAQISSTYASGRQQAAQAVNSFLVQTYWQVGQHIVEFEQNGKDRAEYGAGLMHRLSADLRTRHGKGFSRSNLISMRQFYLLYPKSQKPSGFLSWSHYVELIRMDDPLERGFYEQQAIAERWSVPELKRQYASALFLRLAASKDKAGILQLARQGQRVATPEDLLRQPYVFEFLKIPETAQVSETQLETALIENLQHFLLELGKGFTFVGRQYRITVGGTHYRVDLVFYHRILRCFVLIDLKMGDVQHHDIGQMNLYLGYFAKEENTPDDQPPIGIILSRNKDELLVEYATYGMDSQLFVQKYQLYLPDKEELRREIELSLRAAGDAEGVVG
ncbi:PDDEXK nuclease domain-containing protein [Comamonas badia]|uniref:PDDEXK nuclease domain-containing protein n=1 Tax=Comamonas badia TaxID=265291 RepID=UPI000427A02F|nr:PDDEXK nuclease domain-containing protein [Comamonas badia]